MPQPAGLDAATIGAFQNFLGLPATMLWDPQTEAAFYNFQRAKGWGENFGMTGDQTEWATLVTAMSTGDRTKVQVTTPRDRAATEGPGGVPVITSTSSDGSSSPGTGGGGGSGQDTAKANNSARALIQDTLRQWGLDSLGDWAWTQIQQGNTEMLPTLIRNTAEYKARFKGLEARRAAGLNVMSESQYIQLENDYRTIMSSYGLPKGVFDTQDYLANFIAGDLSPNELNDRLRIYQDAMYNAPGEVRQNLSRLYGATEGGLLAYYIDQEKALPVLEAQYKASSAAAAAQRAGFASFDRTTAERLAQLGADGDSFTKFANLKSSAELFNPLGAVEQGRSLNNDEAAIAAFGGDAEGAETLKKRAEGRVASFSGGGGVVGNSKGLSGAGSADR